MQLSTGWFHSNEIEKISHNLTTSIPGTEIPNSYKYLATWKKLKTDRLLVIKLGDVRNKCYLRIISRSMKWPKHTISTWEQFGSDKQNLVYLNSWRNIFTNFRDFQISDYLPLLNNEE